MWGIKLYSLDYLFMFISAYLLHWSVFIHYTLRMYVCRHWMLLAHHYAFTVSLRTSRCSLTRQPSNETLGWRDSAVDSACSSSGYLFSRLTHATLCYASATVLLSDSSVWWLRAVATSGSVAPLCSCVRSWCYTLLKPDVLWQFSAFQSSGPWVSLFIFLF